MDREVSDFLKQVFVILSVFCVFCVFNQKSNAVAGYWYDYADISWHNTSAVQTFNDC